MSTTTFHSLRLQEIGSRGFKEVIISRNRLYKNEDLSLALKLNLSLMDEPLLASSAPGNR